MSHVSSAALHRRLHRLLLPPVAEIAGNAMTPSVLPRAHFDAPYNRSEPLRRTPLSPCSFAPSGCRFRQARDLTTAGHGATAATDAIART